jgi:hypothetical protein
MYNGIILPHNIVCTLFIVNDYVMYTLLLFEKLCDTQPSGTRK